jgi:hypothetical protein
VWTENVTLQAEHEEKNMKSNSRVQETSDDVQPHYLVTVAIEDEMTAELTARAMGWVPFGGCRRHDSLGSLEGYRCG